MKNLLPCKNLPEFVELIFVTTTFVARSLVAKRTITLVFLISSALSLQAQNLYQIEVIVFENNDPAAASEETWPQPTSLIYPDNVIALLPEISAESAANSNTAATNAVIGTDITSVATNPPPTPTLYSELPLQKKMLGDWRDRLRGSRNYRVLSHSSWLQPASGADAGKAVVIRGGNQYGEHFELEGSIQIIGSTTPFKLFTHLWLSSFIPSGGSVESKIIPLQLPPLPKPPAPLTATNTMTAADSTATNESAIDTENTNVNADTANINTATAPLYSIQRIIIHRSEDNLMPNKPLYLDHPVLGVLIKISEYQADSGLTANPPTAP